MQPSLNQTRYLCVRLSSKISADDCRRFLCERGSESVSVYEYPATDFSIDLSLHLGFNIFAMAVPIAYFVDEVRNIDSVANALWFDYRRVRGDVVIDQSGCVARLGEECAST